MRNHTPSYRRFRARRQHAIFAALALLFLLALLASSPHLLVLCALLAFVVAPL